MKKFFIILSIFVALGAALTVGSLNRAKTWVTQNLMSEFSKEDLQTDLKSYLTEVKGVQRLQVAELKQMEKLTRTSRRKVLWQKLELPPVVVALEVPVIYSYYVDLKKDWSIEELDDGRLQIIVPPLEYNAPAADVSALQIKVEKSSMFRNEKSVAKKLMAELTDYLDLRASEQVSLVREQARKELAEIISQWSESRQNISQVELIFPSEVSNNQSNY